MKPPLVIRFSPRRHYFLHYLCMALLCLPSASLLYAVFGSQTMSFSEPRKGGMGNILLIGVALVTIPSATVTLGGHILGLWYRLCLVVTDDSLLFVRTAGITTRVVSLRSLRMEEIASLDIIRGSDSPGVFDLLTWRNTFPVPRWDLGFRLWKDGEKPGRKTPYDETVQLGDIGDEGIRVLQAVLTDNISPAVAIGVAGGPGT